MEKLKNEIKEDYGKITYTYTAYHKMKDKNIKINNIIKISQILLTVISATGFLATIIANKIALSWIGGITAVISLFLNIYTKDFKLLDDANTYKDAADELWILRQKYISLLIDFDYLKREEIVSIRDNLLMETDVINKKYPGTTKYGYKKARKALKFNEEQYFSDEELDKMLPQSLRNNK